MSGKELTAWRTDRGLQQQQLAKRLRLHVITVNRYENGAKEIPYYITLALIGLDALEGKLPDAQAKKLAKKAKK